MYLTRPMQITFAIAVLLAVVALLLFLNVLNVPGLPSFWLMTAAFVLLALGNVIKGL